MESQKRKPLTHADTISAEEAYRTRYDISEEVARKMGYPSARLYRMDVELAELADEWRRTKSESVLKDYHLLYYKMIAFGLSPDAFSPDTEIDPKFMPERPKKQQSRAE